MANIIFILFIFNLIVQVTLSSCVGKTILKSRILSCQNKQQILDEHNRLRQFYGQHFYGQNIMEMVWSEEFAAEAERLVNSCESMRHGKFQNIARTWNSKPEDTNWRTQISYWFSRNLTQMVFGNLFMVGCAYSEYYDQTFGCAKNYVCIYGPSLDSYENSCQFGMSNRYPSLCSSGMYYLGNVCSYYLV